MRVRPERAADRERIFALQAAAFGRPDEAELVEALRASAQPRLSLVAEVEGEPVGHVCFSPAAIEGPPSGPACAALAPVGVLPQHRRRGVASALIRAGLARGSGLGWQAVFLVGDPAFYARFGFALAAPHGLHYAGEAFDPVFQVLELRPGALRGCRGRVRFHEAFEGLGAPR